MVLRTRHVGTLMIDGKEIAFDSASLTVGELLETYSVMLVGDDRVEPSRDTKLVNGMTPTVVRVGGEIQQEIEADPVHGAAPSRSQRSRSARLASRRTASTA